MGIYSHIRFALLLLRTLCHFARFLFLPFPQFLPFLILLRIFSAESPSKKHPSALLHQPPQRQLPVALPPYPVLLTLRFDPLHLLRLRRRQCPQQRCDLLYVPRRFRKKLHRAHIGHRQQPRAQRSMISPSAAASTHILIASVKLFPPALLGQSPVKPTQTRQRTTDAELLLRPLQRLACNSGFSSNNEPFQRLPACSSVNLLNTQSLLSFCSYKSP